MADCGMSIDASMRLQDASGQTFSYGGFVNPRLPRAVRLFWRFAFNRKKMDNFLSTLLSQTHSAWDGHLVGHVVRVADIDSPMCICVEYVPQTRLYNVVLFMKIMSECTLRDVKGIVQVSAEALTDAGVWVGNSLERTDRVAVYRHEDNLTCFASFTGYTKHYLRRRYQEAMRTFPYHLSLIPVFECIMKAHHFTLMKCSCRGLKCTGNNTASCDPHNMWSFDYALECTEESRPIPIRSPCSSRPGPSPLASQPTIPTQEARASGW